jgi:tetratricopeptide (TPR) repeat protein
VGRFPQFRPSRLLPPQQIFMARTDSILPAALAASLWLLAAAAFSQSPDAGATIDRLYAQALDAKRNGDVNTAIAKYHAMLKLDPKLAPAYNNLGLLYFQQNDYARAIESLEQGMRADPKMTTALVPLGTAYFQIGQFAKSREVLDRAVRLNPSDETAQLYRARSLFSLGQREAGSEALQKLLQKSPGNVEALYTLGQMYMKLAQETLKRLEVQAPDSYLTNLVSGQLLESMENYDGALAQYSKAVEKEPGFRGAHYNIGNIYWLEGKWDQAIVELTREISADPYHCLAHWKIGNCLINLNKEPDQAMDHVKKALEICPNLAQAHLDLGRLLAGNGEYSQAIARYHRVVELNPEESSVHFLLANAYRRLGRMEEAEAESRIMQEMIAKARSARESRQ